MREKEGFRDNLERIDAAFPGREMLMSARCPALPAWTVAKWALTGRNTFAVLEEVST